MIRVGIIGLGMIGRIHYSAWAKVGGAEVVAIADSDPARAGGDLSGSWSNLPEGAAAADMSRIKGTTDFRKLIEMNEVDLVDVCTPTPMHEEMAVAALKAGKHVVCEKPLARTAQAAERIARAAADAPGIFLPAMCMRFWPQWAWLKDAAGKGTYGAVRHATFRRVGSMPPGWFRDGKMSGGALLDLHLHDTDFVHFLLGMPKAVASCGYKVATGCIDHVVTRYIYDDVPVVVAEGGWGMADGFGFNMSCTVSFAKATAEYDMKRPDPLMLYAGGKAQPVQCEGTDGYQAELAYAAACIQKKKRPTIVTAAEAVQSIRIVEAEQKSVETNQPVSL